MVEFNSKMRLLLVLWLAAFVASAPPPHGQLDSGLQPPPAPSQQVATKRLGFTSSGGDSMFGKIAHWFFPSNEGPGSPARAIARSPYVHGPPTRGHPHPPPPKFFGPPPRSKSVHPHPGPPPPLKCNPCNKVPWVPMAHAQYQDGANVFAVVNAPQLHQGLHGGSQPNAPVYHHSPLPQGYLPTFIDNNNKHNGGDQVISPSGGGVPSGSGSAPEIIPSIPVADFVSSIEYPINVVQSPIIDVGTGTGTSGHGNINNNNHYKSLDNVPNEVPAPETDYSNHNTDNVPAPTGSSASGGDHDHNLNVPQPFIINSEIGNTADDGSTNNNNNNNGGASSYQNVNLHAEHTEHKEVHSGGPSDVSITPSVQTSVDTNNNGHEQHENVQVVYKPYHPEVAAPSPIPTQQQPPHPAPPAPFHIQTFQQPPSAQAPTIFNPTAGFPVSGPTRFVPHPHPQPIFYNNGPLPTYQQPPRVFTSPGQINLLRQIPSAPDLSPPPPPPPQPGHPYRFEIIPPSGNALQNLNQQILSESPTVPPTADYSPWSVSATEQPTAPPPQQTSDIGSPPLSSSHAVPSQNNYLDLDGASGLRSQWHHREINHQFQESRIQQESRPVETTTTTTSSPPVVTTPGTSTTVHILSTNIHSLLRAEQQRQQQQKLLQPNPNLLRLQNNIDQWTAQEYSNNDIANIVNTEDKHKGTTATATLIPSKIIPNEYFSTSPSYAYFPSTTSAPKFFDHEAQGSISHNVHAKTRTGSVKFSKVERPIVSTVVDTTTEDLTTTILTTTEEPAITTMEPRRTTWEQALLGYSTSTKEKVYVVTPMNTHQWTDVTTPRPRTTSTTEKVTKPFVIKGRGNNNKQTSTPAPTTPATPTGFTPRFTVRPTPGPRGSAPSAPSGPGDAVNRGNRFYTVPVPVSYQASIASTTERTTTIERRSTSGLPEDLSTLATASPPDGQSVHIAAKPSKVVTVVTSSSSSTSLHSTKKATRLDVKAKPVLHIDDVTADDSKEVEVAAAVREVSAIELKRKPSS